ncbi:ABC transporter permease [Paenibacillus fonticola]|uniref:ABC transporter permease n=1 Tax=Paenibacillus fonticola TaxID=379896 RepID=UPI000382C6B7|nr:ABC transporter permease [Paenibacillus fonticola]
MNRPTKLLSYALRMFSVAGFLLVWMWLVRANLIWPLQFGNLPDPIDVIATWLSYLKQGSYYKNILVSTARVLSGIALGFFTALPIGMWIGQRKLARDALFPSLELFRPIPLIAFLPVAMLLFPTIESSIIFITFLGAFFPILISTKDAAGRVPPSLVQSARCLGCGPARLIWRVYLPAMLPEVFTGLSVGVGASWMGVITGEMMSGQTGIGYTTWQAYHLLDYQQSIIGMFTIGMLGFASSALVRGLERTVIKWK